MLEFGWLRSLFGYSFKLLKNQTILPLKPQTQLSNYINSLDFEFNYKKKNPTRPIVQTLKTKIALCPSLEGSTFKMRGKLS